MQRSHLQMVMIVDEFGGTAGLVTLQDLIAEIIGERPEVESPEELSVQMLDERTFLVQAQMDLEEVNELLDFNFPLTDEYQTLAGFLLYHFQKIPIQGETLHYDDLDLTIVSAQGPRLNQIRIYRQESTVTLQEDISLDDVAPMTTKANERPTDDTFSEIDEESSLDYRQDSDGNRDNSTNQ
jgi:CBS domain containing-hemolysin-like protein